ncbi:MAG TPA: ATP-dependent Clp protease proteolytic subunit [Candidatus Methylomirabilis sp.]
MKSLSDLFWIFFILMAIQPVIKQKMLEAARQRLIAKIERQFGSRLILLVHRQETMALLGFPVLRYIDVQDSEEIMRAIRLTDPEIPLDLVLHTPGGLVLAATQIASALHKHKARVRVFVPHYAMSGGTLIALAADEIVMDEHAVLGPVDPQLGEYPAASLIRLRREKPIQDIDDRTLILADVAEKALFQIHETLRLLLSDKYEPAQAEEITNILSQGIWTHDNPITFEKAKEWGLKVSSEMPPDIHKLMALFPQPVRRQVGVEYLPWPRRRDKLPGATGQRLQD